MVNDLTPVDQAKVAKDKSWYEDFLRRGLTGLIKTTGHYSDSRVFSPQIPYTDVFRKSLIRHLNAGVENTPMLGDWIGQGLAQVPVLDQINVPRETYHRTDKGFAPNATKYTQNIISNIAGVPYDSLVSAGLQEQSIDFTGVTVQKMLERFQKEGVSPSETFLDPLLAKTTTHKAHIAVLPDAWSSVQRQIKRYHISKEEAQENHNKWLSERERKNKLIEEGYTLTDTEIAQYDPKFHKGGNKYEYRPKEEEFVGSAAYDNEVWTKVEVKGQDKFVGHIPAELLLYDIKHSTRDLGIDTGNVKDLLPAMMGRMAGGLLSLGTSEVYATGVHAKPGLEQFIDVATMAQPPFAQPFLRSTLPAIKMWTPMLRAMRSDDYRAFAKMLKPFSWDSPSEKVVSPEFAKTVAQIMDTGAANLEEAIQVTNIIANRSTNLKGNPTEALRRVIFKKVDSDSLTFQDSVDGTFFRIEHLFTPDGNKRFFKIEGTNKVTSYANATVGVEALNMNVDSTTPKNMLIVDNLGENFRVLRQELKGVENINIRAKNTGDQLSLLGYSDQSGVQITQGLLSKSGNAQYWGGKTRGMGQKLSDEVIGMMGIRSWAEELANSGRTAISLREIDEYINLNSPRIAAYTSYDQFARDWTGMSGTSGELSSLPGFHRNPSVMMLQHDIDNASQTATRLQTILSDPVTGEVMPVLNHHYRNADRPSIGMAGGFEMYDPDKRLGIEWDEPFLITGEQINFRSGAAADENIFTMIRDSMRAYVDPDDGQIYYGLALEELQSDWLQNLNKTMPRYVDENSYGNDIWKTVTSVFTRIDPLTGRDRISAPYQPTPSVMQQRDQFLPADYQDSVLENLKLPTSIFWRWKDENNALGTFRFNAIGVTSLIDQQGRQIPQARKGSLEPLFGEHIEKLFTIHATDHTGNRNIDTKLNALNNSLENVSGMRKNDELIPVVNKLFPDNSSETSVYSGGFLEVEDPSTGIKSILETDDNNIYVALRKIQDEGSNPYIEIRYGIKTHPTQPSLYEGFSGEILSNIQKGMFSGVLGAEDTTTRGITKTNLKNIIPRGDFQKTLYTLDDIKDGTSGLIIRRVTGSRVWWAGYDGNRRLTKAREVGDSQEAIKNQVAGDLWEYINWTADNPSRPMIPEDAWFKNEWQGIGMRVLLQKTSRQDMPGLLLPTTRIIQSRWQGKAPSSIYALPIDEKTGEITSRSLRDNKKSIHVQAIDSIHRQLLRAGFTQNEYGKPLTRLDVAKTFWGKRRMVVTQQADEPSIWSRGGDPKDQPQTISEIEGIAGAGRQIFDPPTARRLSPEAEQRIKTIRARQRAEGRKEISEIPTETVDDETYELGAWIRTPEPMFAYELLPSNANSRVLLDALHKIKIKNTEFDNSLHDGFGRFIDEQLGLAETKEAKRLGQDVRAFWYELNQSQTRHLMGEGGLDDINFSRLGVDDQTSPRHITSLKHLIEHIGYPDHILRNRTASKEVLNTFALMAYKFVNKGKNISGDLDLNIGLHARNTGIFEEHGFIDFRKAIPWKASDLSGEMLGEGSPKTLKDLYQSQKTTLLKEQPHSASGKGRILAWIDFDNDGRSIINATEAADFHTLVHEVAHMHRREMLEEELDIIGPILMGKKQYDDLPDKWIWTVKSEEAWADAVERYVLEGKHKKGLKAALDKFIIWLRELYRSIKGTPSAEKMNPRLVKFLDDFIEVNRPSERAIRRTVPAPQIEHALAFWGYSTSKIRTAPIASNVVARTTQGPRRLDVEEEPSSGVLPDRIRDSILKVRRAVAVGIRNWEEGPKEPPTIMGMPRREIPDDFKVKAFEADPQLADMGMTLERQIPMEDLDMDDVQMEVALEAEGHRAYGLWQEMKKRGVTLEGKYSDTEGWIDKAQDELRRGGRVNSWEHSLLFDAIARRRGGKSITDFDEVLGDSSTKELGLDINNLLVDWEAMEGESGIAKGEEANRIIGQIEGDIERLLFSDLTPQRIGVNISEQHVPLHQLSDHSLNQSRLYKADEKNWSVIRNNIETEEQARRELPWDEYHIWAQENPTKAAEGGLPELPDMKSMDVILDTNFLMDSWETMAQNVPPIRWIAKIFSPHAGSQDARVKSMVALNRMISQIDNLVTQTMSRITRFGDVEKIWGKIDEAGRIAEGPLTGFNINDIRSRPMDPRWASKLTPIQREWIIEAEKIQKARLKSLQNEGIDIKLLDGETREESGADWVFAGRRVFALIAADGEVLDYQHVGKQPSGRWKMAEEAGRKFETAEEAIEAGYRYFPELEGMAMSIHAAYRRIAHERWIKYVENGLISLRTPRQSEEAAFNLAAKKSRLKNLEGLLSQLHRTKRGENIHPSTLRALKDHFPEFEGALDEISQITLDHLIRAGEQAKAQPISFVPSKQMIESIFAKVVELEAQVEALTRAGQNVPDDLMRQLNKAKQSHAFKVFARGEAYENFKNGKGFQYTFSRSARSILMEPRDGLIDELINVLQGTKVRKGLIGEARDERNAAQLEATRSLKASREVKFTKGEAVLPDIPAFRSRIFTHKQPMSLDGKTGQEVAEDIKRELVEKYKDPEGVFWSALQASRPFTTLYKFFHLGMDASVFGIHLMLLSGDMATRPKQVLTWAHPFQQGLSAFVASTFSPDRSSKIIYANRELLAKYPDVKISGGSTVDAGYELSEYARRIKRGGFVRSKPLRLLGKIVIAPYIPLQRGFESALDEAAINLLKSLDHLAIDDRAIREISDFVNNIRGVANPARLGVSTKQRLVESTMMLANNYNRAVFASLMDFVQLEKRAPRPFRRFDPEINLRTQLMRDRLVRGMLGVIGIWQAIYYAQGLDIEEMADRLNPTHPMFLTSNFGEVNIGSGGKYRSILKLIGQMTHSIRTGDGAGFDEWGMENPLIRFIRGQAGYFPGAAYTALSRRTYMGDRMWGGGMNPAEIGLAFGKHVFPGPFLGPIWMRAALLEGGNLVSRTTRGFGEFIGDRSNTEGAAQIIREYANDAIGIDYEDMVPFERRLLRKILNPTLSKMMIERIERGDSNALYWAKIEDNDEARLRKEFKLLEQYNSGEGKFASSNPDRKRVFWEQFYAIQDDHGGERNKINEEHEKYQDDVEYDPDDAGKFVLSEWYGIYEEAETEFGTIDHDKVEHLQNNFWKRKTPDGIPYSQLQINKEPVFDYIERERYTTPHPKQMRFLLPADKVKEYDLAHMRRMRHLYSRGNWSDVLDKNGYSDKDLSIWRDKQ